MCVCVFFFLTWLVADFKRFFLCFTYLVGARPICIRYVQVQRSPSICTCLNRPLSRAAVHRSGTWSKVVGVIEKKRGRGGERESRLCVCFLFHERSVTVAADVSITEYAEGFGWMMIHGRSSSMGHLYGSQVTLSKVLCRIFTNSTGPTQEPCPRSCRLSYGSHPATWSRSHRSFRSSSWKMYCSLWSADDLCEVWRVLSDFSRRSPAIKAPPDIRWECLIQQSNEQTYRHFFDTRELIIRGVDLNEDCFLGLFKYFHEISVFLGFFL